jgi:hypothetical protein
MSDSPAALFHAAVAILDRSSAGEQVLFDDGVDAPIAVDHLGDAEVDGDRLVIYINICVIIDTPLCVQHYAF